MAVIRASGITSLAVLLLTTAAALAQGNFGPINEGAPDTQLTPMSVQAGSASRIGAFDDPTSARDGCINVPGRAHSSSDCSPIYKWDPSWVVPNKPLDQMTGAEENMVRSYNILHPMTSEALKQATGH